MNVIFLDIDGVLNYEGSKARMLEGTYFVEDDKLSILKDMVKATQAELVLSSSWRKGWTLGNQDEREEITDSKEYFMLCAKLHEFGLNLLSEIPREYDVSREENINYWINEWPGDKVENYVILDDEASKFSSDNQHLILISNKIGLMPEDIEKAVSILKSEELKVHRKKILIVDDVFINRELMKAMLCSEFDILEAENGLIAKDILDKEENIDLIITDIQMPGMNGIKLIQDIRSNHKFDKVPIIANTQYGEQQQQEEILDMGANEFIYKPYSPKFIMLRVKNLLKLRKVGI